MTLKHLTDAMSPCAAPDENGDEEDGRDETICPVDHAQNGIIIDDDIFNMIIAPLPAGVEFTILTGTVIDLPYMLTCGDKLVKAIESGEAVIFHTEPNPVYSGWDLARETLAMGSALFKYGIRKARKRLVDRLNKAPLS
ncbi:hypothetical protein JKP88DRAFT_267002 [Tribonema minus]|uniref:Uncharacterized protein n=1 Tax=Tribonema minus TaxID=303371 RepID=A0A835ZGK7_9STRA|nr:hypothetical protein JKP88DRAFT_267002 [Tribonema minus]